MVDRRTTVASLTRSLTLALGIAAVISACGDDEPGAVPGTGKPDGSGGTSGAAGNAGRGGASGNAGRGGAAGANGASGSAGSVGDAGVSGAAGSAGSAGVAGSGGSAGLDASTDASDANTPDSGGIVNVCARLGNVTLIQNEFVPRYFGDVAADCRVRSFVVDNPQLATMGNQLRLFNAVFWGCDTTRPVPGFNLVHFWNVNTTLTAADAERLIDIYVRIARTALTLNSAEDARMRQELTLLSQSVITEQSTRYSRSQCDAGTGDGGPGDAGSDAGDASVSDSSDDGSVSDASDDVSDADTDSDGADT